MNILLVKKKSVTAWHMQCGQADFDDVITKFYLFSWCKS